MNIQLLSTKRLRAMLAATIKATGPYSASVKILQDEIARRRKPRPLSSFLRKGGQRRG